MPAMPARKGEGSYASHAGQKSRGHLCQSGIDAADAADPAAAATMAAAGHGLRSLLMLHGRREWP